MWAYKEVKMIHWCLRQPETSPIQSPSGSSVLCVVWASGDFLYKLLEQFQTLEKTLNRHSRKIHALSRRKIKPMKLHLWELWVWAEYLNGCENRGWARRLTGHWVLAISPILCRSWTVMLGKCQFPYPSPTLLPCHFNMGAPATMPISSLSSFSLQQLLSWLLLNSQSTEEKGMCDFPACGHSPPAWDN